MSLNIRFRHAFADLPLDIALDAPTPGTTVLFGRSGSGKSTIIAAVAGLLRPADCRIAVDDVTLVDTTTNHFMPPEHRRIGLVFQDSRLFPHMTVATNLRYGLRRAPKGPIAFDDVVDLLGIATLLDRRPHSLSGGEKSRVAIGRALLSQPRLLCMDEPLASLDAQHKAEIVPYLGRLKHALQLPILYVTHALDEVVRLADTLVLIRAGRVLAAGPLEEIVARGDLPLAARDDAAAVLSARVMAHAPTRQLTELRAGGRLLLVPLLDAAPGSAVRVRIPAREVILAAAAPQGISVHNVIAGTVHGIVQDPGRHAAMVEVALDDAGLLARVTPDAVTRLGLAPGKPVLALVKSMAVEILPD
jgi:molybdate transport system ATP-binding protein